MKTQLPDGCGNSPRMAIVSQFAVDWAAENAEAMRECLAEDADWALAGTTESTRGAHFDPPLTPDAVTVVTAISHGKFACCDGYLEQGDRRVDFCHVFRFTGAAKTAKMAEIRTYLAPVRGHG